MKYTYEPSLGENIRTTVKSALALSVRKNGIVSFTFNGITMEVNQNSTVEHSLTQWETLCKVRQEDYNNSPEGKVVDVKRKLELKAAQDKMDNLMDNLPTDDNKALVEWLIKYTTAADHVGVVHDKAVVMDNFYNLGFEENMWVGFKGKWTTGHELEWIVGQVISCLGKFNSPHPVTISFCEKWLAKVEG